MIESRCGLLCDKCGYKDEVECIGCLNIQKPFWGEVCPIKSCCESKEYNHCGECSKFACELLVAFSYDKNQGDDGKRVEQCKIWSQKNLSGSL
ncbi:DUF3795 domain-containing protein [Clostridioides mangenotii]|uniref:DUF3795 domain-containing protein n=1 Tax=Metaclostridioides mangenotii TaxID=1540 RepID=UPI002149BA3E|nr:DUF3795 domain-containing protein [Clostridioides mangenotii]MCR1954057.1 DUF3795 domain-containing protein [Clostridioides mangenotii]